MSRQPRPSTHLVGVLHSKDLIAQIDEVVERRLSRDGVDEHEALAVLHVEVTHRGELLLKTVPLRSNMTRRTKAR